MFLTVAGLTVTAVGPGRVGFGGAAGPLYGLDFVHERLPD